MLLSEVKQGVRVRHDSMGEGTIIGLFKHGYNDFIQGINKYEENICVKFDKNYGFLHRGYGNICNFKGEKLPDSPVDNIYFCSIERLQIIESSSSFKPGSLEASISLLEELDKEVPKIINEVIIPKTWINTTSEKELRKDLLEIAKKDASLNITLDPSVFNVKLPTLNTNS